MAEKVARIRSISGLAPEILLVESAMVDPPALPFRAGQFVSLRCADEQRRSYSIASSSTRHDGFDLLVKLVPGGAGSRFFQALRPGDELHFTGPMGFFTCELRHPGDAIFAVTGSGIAAALPMIEETLARSPTEEAGHVRLYWGLRHEHDVFWRDRLDALAAASPRFAYHICLSHPGPTWGGTNGRITEHVVRALPALREPTFYLVGNGDMIRDLRAALVAKGVDRKRQIRHEAFYPASEP